jgi:TRAP-type mannitol/chloroaromatic compound transport system permease large subunit
MAEPSIAVIVPVRNGAATLPACLASIVAAARGFERVELIVADNGSTDESQAVARSHGATVVSLPRLRVSAVRNKAASQAHADLLAFIDADHVIAPEWLSAACAILRGDARVAGAGAEYHAPKEGTWVQRAYDCLRRHDVAARQTDWLPSGNLVVRSEVFRDLGGFDERLETCEDVDFCARLLRSGRMLVSDPRLHSIHLGDPRRLADVFLGELWRGRDNLKVTFRTARTWRSVASAMQPLVTVVVVIGGLVAAAAFPERSATALGAALTFVIAASLPRTLQMLVRSPARSLRTLLHCSAVALVFDLGRAAALVARAGHSARRRPVPNPAPERS